jgi:hypothetical protein
MLVVMLRIAPLLGVVLVAGCQTISSEELAYADDQQCQSLGAYPGSAIYAECRIMLYRRHQADAADAELRRLEFAAAVLDGLRSMYGVS